LNGFFGGLTATFFDFYGFNPRRRRGVDQLNQLYNGKATVH